jgi:hypothetical protein
MADEPQAAPLSINEPNAPIAGDALGRVRAPQPPALAAPQDQPQGGRYAWIEGAGWVWVQDTPSPFSPQQQPTY